MYALSVRYKSFSGGGDKKGRVWGRNENSLPLREIFVLVVEQMSHRIVVVDARAQLFLKVLRCSIKDVCQLSECMKMS